MLHFYRVSRPDKPDEPAATDELGVILVTRPGRRSGSLE